MMMRFCKIDFLNRRVSGLFRVRCLLRFWLILGYKYWSDWILINEQVKIIFLIVIIYEFSRI